MPKITPTNCFLCATPSPIQTTDDGYYEVECTRCCNYRISDAARVMLETLPERFRVALHHATGEYYAQHQPVTITIQNIATLVGPFL